MHSLNRAAPTLVQLPLPVVALPTDCDLKQATYMQNSCWQLPAPQAWHHHTYSITIGLFPTAKHALHSREEDQSCAPSGSSLWAPKSTPGVHNCTG